MARTGTLGALQRRSVQRQLRDRRRELAATPIRPSLWGLFGVVGSVLLLVVGTAGAEVFTQRVSLILLLASIVLEPYHLPGDHPGIQALDRVLQRCLAKDPGDRHRSAAELRRALVPALQDCPPLA